jgi:hypothetical protein
MISSPYSSVSQGFGGPSIRPLNISTSIANSNLGAEKKFVQTQKNILEQEASIWKSGTGSIMSASP